MSNQGLDSNAILTSEFEYIAKTAHQAHEDRVRVYQHLTATVGTLLVAAIFNQSDIVNEAGLSIDPAWFAILFLILAIVGTLSFFKLIALRTAWAKSVHAMNAIKQHYMNADDTAQLTEAITWTNETPPDIHRFFCVGFLVGLTVTILNTTSLGAALYFLNPGPLARSYTFLITAAIATALTTQILYWRYHLRKVHNQLFNRDNSRSSGTDQEQRS